MPQQPTMRIRGLLKAFDQVRCRLQAGLRPAEVEPFVSAVRTLIRQVEQICTGHGLTPEHLPSPSRRAYRFLRELDLANLPVVRETRAAPEPSRRLVISHVRGLERHYADRFWRQLQSLVASPDGRRSLQEELERHVKIMEQVCARHGTTPGALEAPSRRVYRWLKWLVDHDHFQRHLAALERAATALAGTPAPFPAQITVHLQNMEAIWRKKASRQEILLRINQGFVHAPDDVWMALMKTLILDRHAGSDIRLKHFTSSPEFNGVRLELLALAEPARASTQGYAHNLEESFARVNAAYFGSRLGRPRLTWNRALTGRKFGHYQPSTDTVMLSVSLDRPEVPEFVVDFVMYHELLHKKHGIRISNGRRVVHSPSFRKEEQLFARYQEAEAWLTTRAHQA